MAKKKIEAVEEKVEEEVVGKIEQVTVPKILSTKEEFLALYQLLQDLGISRLSDLENLIARTEL